MGMIVKLLVTAAVVFGFHYAVKQIVATTVTAELGELPQGPTMPTISIDPEALRRAQEIGRAVDTTAQRAAIDDAMRQVDQLNRSMPIAPMPPRIPVPPGR